MLTAKSFIEWADEHVVVLISHNELGHDPVTDETVTGEGAETCPLYPGLTCRDHLDIAVETDNSRDESLPTIPFIELCPNSWLIRPDGQVQRIEEKDQFAATAVKKQTAAVQKELGAPLPRKQLHDVLQLVRRADEAAADETWRPALEALAGVFERVKEPPASLRALVAARMESMNEDVAYALEFTAEEKGPLEEKVAEIRALAEAIDVSVGGKYLAAREAIRAWLAEHGQVVTKR